MRQWLAIMGLGLLLGACVARPEVEPVVPPPQPTAARPAEADGPVVTARTLPPMPRPRPADIPPRPVAAAPAAAPAPVPEAAPPVPAPPRAEVQAALAPPPRINPVGLDEPALLRAFGQPERRTEDPPAQVWHYGNGECAVNFYLYLDVARNQFRVARTWLVKGRPERDAKEACISRLAASHGQS